MIRAEFFTYLLLFLFLIVPVFSQSSNSLKVNGIGVGFKFDANFNQLPDDFKFGININTPYFLDNCFSIRFEADYGFLRGIPTNSIYSNETWSSYYAFKSGLIVVASQKTIMIRPYIELGGIGFIPSSTFTDEKFAWGIYGLLGFELLFDPESFFCFYFEFSGIGILSGGDTSKFIAPSIYGTGIIVTLGYRFYL